MSYHTGKIYKIVSKQTDKIYIGSTRQILKERFNNHKKYYNAYILTNKAECSSIYLLKYEDCEIVLIELYPCETRLELYRREGEIQIENINIIVNKNIAGRTNEQYYIDNKEKIVKKMAQRYQDNKAKIVVI